MYNSLLGLVPILEAMDDWDAVEKVLDCTKDDPVIRHHLMKYYRFEQVIQLARNEKRITWVLDGVPHNSKGPAYLRYQNDKLIHEEWRIHGVLHKIQRWDEQGNITEKKLYKDGKLHCIDEPAYMISSCIVGGLYITEEQWHKDGKLHRIDAPAWEIFCNADQNFRLHPSIIKKRYEAWYQNGRLHRIGGPSIIDYIKNKTSWYIDGRLHRLDGPAIVDDEEEYWYKKGKLWYNLPRLQ